MQNVKGLLFYILHFTFCILKIMKKVLLLLCLSPLFACGQVVKKAYAFYKVQAPGNIPVDDEGRPLGGADTVRFVYLECAGNSQPSINGVDYRGRVYDATVFAVEDTLLVMKLLNGKDMLLKPGKGNRLWLAELTEGIGRSAYSSKMILRVLINKKRFTVTVGKENEVIPEIRR
jgi:hypothetical protein